MPPRPPPEYVAVTTDVVHPPPVGRVTVRRRTVYEVDEFAALLAAYASLGYAARSCDDEGGGAAYAMTRPGDPAAVVVRAEPILPLYDATGRSFPDAEVPDRRRPRGEA